MNKLQTQFDVSSLLLSDNSIHFDVHGLFDVKYAGNETLKDKTINLKLEISSLYEKFWIIMDLDFDFKFCVAWIYTLIFGLRVLLFIAFPIEGIPGP